MRQYTSTTPAEVNYLMRALEGPAIELLLYRQGEKYDSFKINKAVGACPETGTQIIKEYEQEGLR